MVRVPACHAGGRGFEPRHSRLHSESMWNLHSITSSPSSEGLLVFEKVMDKTSLEGLVKRIKQEITTYLTENINNTTRRHLELCNRFRTSIEFELDLARQEPYEATVARIVKDWLLLCGQLGIDEPNVDYWIPKKPEEEPTVKKISQLDRAKSYLDQELERKHYTVVCRFPNSYNEHTTLFGRERWAVQSDAQRWADEADKIVTEIDAAGYCHVVYSQPEVFIVGMIEAYRDGNN